MNIPQAVRHLVEIVDAAGKLDDLCNDPRSTIEGWPGVTVKYVPEAKSEGSDLVGSYHAKTGTILISESAIPSRQHFTLLHELAHHLQQHDFKALDNLQEAARNVGLEETEEVICNKFAAHILFPPQSTAQHFQDGVTAQAVIALQQLSKGSLAAACVEATSHMSAPGLVAVLDANGHVDFSCPSNLPPLPRRSDQSHVDPVARAIRSNSIATGTAELRYRDGIDGGTVHLQITPVSNRYLLVATTGSPPWADRFVLPTRDSAPRAPEYICEHCGEEYSTFAPVHPTCGQPPCTQCNRCGCQSRSTEQVCTSCFLSQPAAMFTAPSTICRDCVD